MQKFGWFGGVRGHLRSSETSPFDRAYMTSYSTLIETMLLSCTVFELLCVFRRKWPILTHPTCIFRPRRGWFRSNFTMIFDIRKLESCGYRVICVILCLAVLIQYGSVIHTHRQTDRHTTTVKIVDLKTKAIECYLKLCILRIVLRFSRFFRDNIFSCLLYTFSRALQLLNSSPLRMSEGWL